MSARYRVHTDGRVAVVRDGLPSCMVSGLDSGIWCYPVEQVHGEGWSPAVLVVLPEPVPADRKFQVGARFGSVEAGVRRDGAQFIGTGVQGYRTPGEAREVAVGLLAAAAWVEQHTPVPLATGSDREI